MNQGDSVGIPNTSDDNVQVKKKAQKIKTAKINPQFQEVEETDMSLARHAFTRIVTSIRCLSFDLVPKAIEKGGDALFTCGIAEVIRTIDCLMLEGSCNPSSIRY